MSFIGKTEEREINTSGKTYKIFITEQEDGYYWVATILYVDNGVIDTHILIDKDKSNTYQKACDWVFSTIDDKAQIEPL
jgi:hypothetical protein